MQEWRDIKGYEGKYQVSNLGNVKSLNFHRKNKECLLTPKIDKDGYLEIALYKNGKSKYYRIHRLVAIAFISNNENKKEVNHINGIKSDNRVDNLEWCTSSENQVHAYKTGLQKISGGALSNRKKIKCIELNIIKDSIHEMQRYLVEQGYTTNKRISRLSEVMNKGINYYLGFNFKFIEGENLCKM